MKAKSLMVLGTASGVGKSLVTAGLCRLFSNLGIRVAPFKAQNMSNNSFVTAGGHEIGRAQAVQAECARITPAADMNPLLLKPSADNCSQVVLHGKAVGHMSAREYYAMKPAFAGEVMSAYTRLAEAYDLIILEGAGSPVEVNLQAHDLVNLPMAERAGARCILVGDIDRGGIFASLIGTLDLMSEDQRRRVAGLVVNRFRGDRSLFDPGVDFLTQRSGKKVLGVLPFDPDLRIDEEDTAGGPVPPPAAASGALDIAVVWLPHISNFTDIDLLRQEAGVRVRYVRRTEDLARPDLLILPGTKATIADLAFLRQRGFEDAIRKFVDDGGRVLGICGGYQMMGKLIRDAGSGESRQGEAAGFGFFDMTTDFEPQKVLRQVRGAVSLPLFGASVAGEITGYEIHMGRTRHHKSYAPFGHEGAVHENGRLAGTYYHGLFESAVFRGSFLRALAADAGKESPALTSKEGQDLKDGQYERLAGLIKQHLDWEYLIECLQLPLPMSSTS